MNSTRPRALVLSAAVLALAACGGENSGAGSASASGAKSGSASAAKSSAAPPKSAATTPATQATTPATPASASAPASAGPSASAAASAAPAAGGALPADLQKLVDGLKDPEAMNDPKLATFSFKAPKGSTIEASPAPGQWNKLVVDGATMAFVSFDSSDSSSCPKVADMKAKIKGAKDLLDISAKPTPWGKVSLGDEAELWMFEADGKTGFYGRKLFKQGKDSTNFCCAAGTPEEAEELKGRVERDKADALAGVCMTYQLAF
ncbi:MAG: hypothetical protein U0271_12390 [Polyangiaceae bacterium]